MMGWEGENMSHFYLLHSPILEFYREDLIRTYSFIHQTWEHYPYTVSETNDGSSGLMIYLIWVMDIKSQLPGI